MDDLEKRLELLFNAEKYEELLKLALENVYTDKENELLLYTYIILAFMNTGKSDKSLAFVNEALDKHPETSYIIYLKAKLLLSTSKLQEAKQTIEEALSLNADDAEYYLVEARIYFESSNFEEAKKSIDKALNLDSSNLDFHIVNAMSLYMLDDEKLAREIIDEVLQKDSHNKRALDVKQHFFTYKMKEEKSVVALNSSGKIFKYIIIGIVVVIVLVLLYM